LTRECVYVGTLQTLLILVSHNKQLTVYVDYAIRTRAYNKR